MTSTKRKGEEEDLYSRTLTLAQVQKKEYFTHVVSKDMAAILHDIRNADKTDTITTDVTSSVAQVKQQLEDAVNFEGSTEGKKAKARNGETEDLRGGGIAIK